MEIKKKLREHINKRFSIQMKADTPDIELIFAVSYEIFL